RAAKRWILAHAFGSRSSGGPDEILDICWCARGSAATGWLWSDAVRPAADRGEIPAQDRDGHVLARLILGAGLPVWDSARRRPHPCRLHRRQQEEPHVL